MTTTQVSKETIMKKYIALAFALSYSVVHAADAPIELKPELTIAGTDDQAPPAFKIDGATRPLKEFVMNRLPSSIAVVYDYGTVSGGTAAYRKISSFEWATLTTIEQGYFLSCLDAGKWVMYSLKDIARSHTHCLYLGSNSEFTAVPNLLALSWS